MEQVYTSEVHLTPIQLKIAERIWEMQMEVYSWAIEQLRQNPALLFGDLMARYNVYRHKRRELVALPMGYARVSVREAREMISAGHSDEDIRLRTQETEHHIAADCLITPAVRKGMVWLTGLGQVWVKDTPPGGIKTIRLVDITPDPDTDSKREYRLEAKCIMPKPKS